MRKISMILALTFLLLAAAALAHEGHHHVMGTIKTVAADHIEVTTKGGKSVTVPLAAETKYFKGKETAAKADLKVGERVVVDLGKSGAAEKVRLASGKATGHTGHSDH
ncbi:MAG: hypothetical protein ACJ76N_19725 [Thermoanaerobaculia bacterium]